MAKADQPAFRDNSGFPHHHMDAHKHGVAGPLSAEQYEQIERAEQSEREKIERANKAHVERDFAARARRHPK